MKLIVGLGNPDKKYQNTKHNFGWIVVDSIADRGIVKFTADTSGKSLITETNIGQEKILLAKPITYMNNSGEAVQALLSFYKINSNDLIVIHDEVALDFGTIRISNNRSSGGHQGLESIIKQLKTKDFTRIRLGIGPQQGASEDFVMTKFAPAQKKKLAELIDSAVLALEHIIENGLDSAANKYN